MIRPTTIRVVLAGIVVWIAGVYVGGRDDSLPVELGVAVIGWIIFLDLTLGHLERKTRRSRAKARALEVQEAELREWSNELLADDFDSTDFSPGHLALILDAVAGDLSDYRKAIL